MVFGVFSPNPPTVVAAEATRIAERLRATVAGQPLEIRGQILKLTVSIGIAALDDDDLGAAVRNADEALYQAKAQGRDQVVFARVKSRILAT